MNNGEAAFPEFNNVYIGPESEERKKPGHFRDGTIIVQEGVSVAATGQSGIGSK